jgi:aminoacylase
VHPNRIVCILTYYGKSREKKSVLLNSHTDVVPVDEKFWKCDAFEGIIDEKGDIYGRGIQDMKSVGIQHLELIRKMKQNNIRPDRTIHLTFVPDEEIGGQTGITRLLLFIIFKLFLNFYSIKDLLLFLKQMNLKK